VGVGFMNVTKSYTNLSAAVHAVQVCVHWHALAARFLPASIFLTNFASYTSMVRGGLKNFSQKIFRQSPSRGVILISICIDRIYGKEQA
jgi:hypothetical protein